MKLGSITPANFKIGDKQVSRIMLGAVEVWSGIDPDAAAWIDAVIAAGGVLRLSASETKSIASERNIALRTDSTGDLYAPIGRFFVPIWQVKEADSICSKTLIPGTYVGDVTHNPEGVRSDGSTGYFDMGATPVGMGCQLNSMQLSALVYDSTHTALASSDRYMGAGADSVSTGQRAFLGATGSGNHGGLGPNNSSALFGSSDGLFRGMLMISRHASNARFAGFRRASGWSVLASDTAASQGINSTRNVMMLCQNNDGTPSSFLRSQMAVGIGTIGRGYTQAQAAQFTLINKQFYEALTGITMP